MYIKIIGALLIVTCCGGCGMLLAAAHRKEVRLLHQLIRCVGVMRSELEFRLTPVPQLCRICAEDLSHPLKEIFLVVADRLERQEVSDAATAMTMAVQADKRLPSATAEQLLNLGQTLGRFDLQGQLRGFEQCARDCAHELKELESNQQQRLRSYQTLGFCAGAALAIILF